MFFLLVAVAAPFEAAYAGWHALARPIAADGNDGVLSSFELQARVDRQRRRLLTCAIVAVVHTVLLLLAAR